MYAGLSLMIKGMAGIFVVVGAIYVSIKILGYFDKKSSDKQLQ